MEQRGLSKILHHEGERNSSIELLRILAMLMVVGHHYCLFAIDLNRMPLSLSKAILGTFVASGGKVGVVLFFAISAWFLTDRGGIRASLRRVWIMEREVLFWSLTLYALSLSFIPDSTWGSLVISSAFPLTSGLWWYPTTYALFLLVCPFLAAGLKKIGRHAHGTLCVMVFAVWIIVDGFYPFAAIDSGQIFTFMVLYSLMTFYKWYMKPLSIKMSWYLIALGYLLIALSVVVIGWFYDKTHSEFMYKAQTFMSHAENMLPVLMIGIGIFALFLRKNFANKAINTLAASTFGVYLITEYPTVRIVMWQSVNTVVKPLSGSFTLIPISLLAIVLVFCAAICLDLVRQRLFRWTMKNQGKWFEYIWNSCAAWGHKHGVSDRLRKMLRE